MKYIAYILITLSLTVSCFAGADGESQAFYAADNSPVVWVKNGGNEKVTITVYGDSNATNVVTIGSTDNVIDMSGTSVDTISELEAAIKACTNSAGKKVLSVYRCAPVGTESVDDEVMATTVTLYAGESGGGMLWDTSDTKHYRVYVPPAKGGAKRGGLAVKKVFGDVKGTGNITIKSYTLVESNATQIDMREYVSPAYVLGVASATNVADEIGPGIIDIPLDIQVGNNQGFLISCDRATTGTTGGVGILTKGR